MMSEGRGRRDRGRFVPLYVCVNVTMDIHNKGHVICR